MGNGYRVALWHLYSDLARDANSLEASVVVGVFDDNTSNNIARNGTSGVL